MWITLSEKEYDLNLIRLNPNGSFHIPVIKKTISETPFEVELMEYSVSFKKTDEGNELVISKKGIVSKKLKYNGDWSRFQEQKESAPNQSTPIPGARRKQLTLADEKTMEQMWRENYDFRARSYHFLQSEWDAADEYGVHIPDRHGHKRGIKFLYYGGLPFLLACLVFLLVPRFFNASQSIEEYRLASVSNLEAAQALSVAEIEESNKRLMVIGETENASDTSPNKKSPNKTETGETNKDFEPSKSKDDDEKRTSPPNSKKNVMETDKIKSIPEKKKKSTDDDPKRIDANAEPKKKTTEDMPPKKIEKVIPPPKTSWKLGPAITDLQIGEKIRLVVSILPNENLPVKFFYHLGPWKEGETKLRELTEDKFEFELNREILEDIKRDDDGIERGTVAAQFLATNNESPYEDDGKTIKEKYKSVILFREKQPLRVFTNKKPTFRYGDNVAKVDSGPIQDDKPSRNIIVHGGKKTFIQPKASDPEGQKYDSLKYEYKMGDSWVVVSKNQIPIDTSKSGKFKVTVRATDDEKRVSNEHVIVYSVNFPPKLESFSTMPKWPVPGGSLRILVGANDPENDEVKYRLKLMANGKEIEATRLSHVDSANEMPVDEGMVLYQIDELESGEFKAELVLADNRHAISDSEVKKLSIHAPKITQPQKPGRKIKNSLGLEFVEIPAGEFVMGSPTNEAARKKEEVLHGVKITRPFFMQTIEFPAQLLSDIEFPDQNYRKDESPASHFRYSKALHVCRYLNELPAEMKAGRSYRLPTEAEWEYACRAGTKSPYNIKEEGGRFLTSKYANINVGGWPKGQKRYAQNAFGLFDMHGNVSEMCIDQYQATFYWEAPIEDPVNIATHSTNARVVRGGDVKSTWKESRSASRKSFKPNAIETNVGFRLVCVQGQAREHNPFKFELKADNDNWLLEPDAWNIKEGKLDIDPRSMPRRKHYLVLKNSVSDFDFSCDFKIIDLANKSREPDCIFGIVPKGTLLESDPPVYNKFALRVCVGKDDWGSVRNSDIDNRGTVVRAKKESLEKLERTRNEGFDKLRVVVRGQHLTVWVNEIKTVEREFKDLPMKGKFGFFWTDYGPKKSKVEVKNAKMKISMK